MKRQYLTRLILCTVLALATGVCGSLQAQVIENIEYGSVGNAILNPDGTPADVGDAVLVGTFPAGFNFGANQTFTSLDSAFTEFGSTNFAAPGQFSATTVITTPGFENMQLYIWFLNDPNPANATGWGIVTSLASNWKVPTDSGSGGNTIIDTSEDGVFVPNGAFGTSAPNNLSPNEVNWQMVAVPEPSTYALVALGAGAVAVARRKRRR